MLIENQVVGENLEIKFTLDAHDQLCLKHDLMDIVKWFSEGPASEKIIACQRRMIRDHRNEIMNDPSRANMSMSEMNELLADPVALCLAISQLPNYKNRSERDQEG